jgi:hypothetical protein
MTGLTIRATVLKSVARHAYIGCLRRSMISHAPAPTDPAKHPRTAMPQKCHPSPFSSRSVSLSGSMLRLPQPLHNRLPLPARVRTFPDAVDFLTVCAWSLLFPRTYRLRNTASPTQLVLTFLPLSITRLQSIAPAAISSG